MKGFRGNGRRWLLCLTCAGCGEFVGVESTTAAGPTPRGSSGAAESSEDDSAAVTTTADSTTGGTSVPPDDETTSAPELTSGEAPSVCGDGALDPMTEQCDDGNFDDDDACSNTCVLARCDDRIRNGDETGTDCGGPCPGCPTGMPCGDHNDCAEGGCVSREDDGVRTCASPSCNDGLLNQGELSPDCGDICGTAPTNVIANGGFDMGNGTAGWVTQHPEVNPQNAYFHDGSNNQIVELDQGSNTTSSWAQSFEVSADDVGQLRGLSFRVGDRVGHTEYGGLIVRIEDPDGNAVALQGQSGPNFDDAAGAGLRIDATVTGSFQPTQITWTPDTAGAHTLWLLEDVDGSELNDGAGIVLDDVMISMIQCPQ